MPSNKPHCACKLINPWDAAGEGVGIRFEEFLGYGFPMLRRFGVNVPDLDGHRNTEEILSRIGKYEVI